MPGADTRSYLDVNFCKFISSSKHNSLLHLWLWWRHDELVVGSWMLASHSGEWCKMKAKFSDAWKNRATNYADDLWLHGSLRVNICMGLLMNAGMCGGAVCVFFLMTRCIDVSKKSIAHSHCRSWDACQELQPPLNALRYRVVSRKCCHSKISGAPSNKLGQLSIISLDLSVNSVCAIKYHGEKDEAVWFHCSFFWDRVQPGTASAIGCVRPFLGLFARRLRKSTFPLDSRLMCYAWLWQKT